MATTAVDMAAAEVIEAAGFDAMARAVRDGKESAAKTLHHILNCGWGRTSPFRGQLEQAYRLVGPFTPDHIDIRRRIERRGRRR